jgi:hypothetical protein
VTGGSTGDGVHEIDADGDGPAAPFDVYCDMSIANGGWTLVGRSAADGSNFEPFGWLYDGGSLDDDTLSYSVDCARLAPFGSLLVGSRGVGNTWGARVFGEELPSGFLALYEESATVVTPATVKGTCNPAGGPQMLGDVGFTFDDDKFFFRDNEIDDVFGLRADGFNTNGGDCAYGGLLDGAQGMIMVR